jgi:hypothetical protein
MYRRVWVLVEGTKDSRFVNHVVRPILENEYDLVQVWEYAQKTTEKVIAFLRAIKCMNADCLFLGDIDDSPCVTAKKGTIRDEYEQAVETPNIVVVAKEIEGWYLADVDEPTCQELGIAPLPRTDELTKEQFRLLIPKRFGDSVVDFMAEVLKRFDISTAKAKNRSFHYLMDKLEAKPKKA